ncbi:ADP-specific phosphofructokinase/glucokinase [Carpediemonas membranifera]|uniref:ADP-specific phosphofructokinase/glucokinase n=1 Tax=Carpediemonas membranifera TaxID=201153 RepID=A0A8J6EBI9_9EUKA|nr:ADP-specific phosphofructokinase/glucokinase [Carpediemonas membranifera]|eukprot:KAG9397315.1 ADP-specific phosphofructokinase/glucokinase [Carpediemonas membranifera]
MVNATRYAFVGYNINLDAQVNMENQADFDGICQLIQKHSPNLLSVFVDSVKNAASCERLVPPSLSGSIKDSFPSNLVVAGQAGFFLTNIVRPEFSGFTPVVHLPNRSADLVNAIMKLSEDIYVFDQTSESGIAKLTAAHIEDVAPPVHVVLEYPADLALTFEGESFVVPKANRFIFTYDPTNMELHLDEHFLAKKDIVNQDWIALVSGYHLLQEDILTDAFRTQHRELVQHFRDNASWLHIELAYSDIHLVREFVLNDILPAGHSIGLNEIELGLFAEESGCFVPTDDHSARLKRWYTTLPNHAVILFHCFGAYISIDVEGRISAKKTQDAFRLAEDVILRSRAVIRDGKNVSVASDVDHDGNPSFNLKRAAVPTALEHNGMTIAEGHIQAYYPKTLKPIASTVGLGDTISSSIAVGINF